MPSWSTMLQGNQASQRLPAALCMGTHTQSGIVREGHPQCTVATSGAELWCCTAQGAPYSARCPREARHPHLTAVCAVPQGGGSLASQTVHLLPSGALLHAQVSGGHWDAKIATSCSATHGTGNAWAMGGTQLTLDSAEKPTVKYLR